MFRLDALVILRANVKLDRDSHMNLQAMSPCKGQVSVKGLSQGGNPAARL